MQSMKRWLAAACLLSSTACVPTCGGPGTDETPDASASGGITSSSSSSGDISSSSSSSSSTSGAPGSSSSGGPGDGGVEGDGGVQTLFLADVVPNSGICAGGFRVRLTGAGFRVASQVFFGEAEADQILLQNQGSITCRVPALAAPGTYDVRIVNPGPDGGPGEESVLTGGWTCFDAVRVTSVTPSEVPTSGGTPITITGSGFEDGQLVVIGGRQATDVVVAEDGLSLTAVTPPGVAGRADVEVVSEFGAGRMQLGLRYVAPLRIAFVDPGVGAPNGGEIVSVFGSGFVEETRVRFGAATARVVDYVGEDELRVAVPAGSAGAVDVIVEQDPLMLSATLPGGYRYVEAGTMPAILSVSPGRGATSGGTRVHLYGRGLDGTMPSVMFGANAGTSVTVHDDSHVSVTTPASTTGTGAVDVTLTRGGNSLSAPGAFTYEDRVKLTSLMPVGGPVEGGTNLTITGVNLAQDCTFTLGGLPLTATVSDSTSATAAAPAGSPGVVDLEVSCPSTGSSVLDEAYTYSAGLSLFSVEPLRGSVAGGTFVRIRGTGFISRATGLQVLFDTTPAEGVHVESDNLIVANTPPHGPGPVAVKLVAGMEEAERNRAFTYYDPAFIVGGVRGGTINGSVNVTMIDIVTGFPVYDALAVLGTETGSQYTAFTDARGQAVLSGPDVYGPQTVTVAHCNYTYTTLAGINASDITLFAIPLFPPRCGPPSPPSGGNPPPPLPPPPVISGVVTGFAKELFDPANLGPNEVAAAFIYHTWPSIYSGPPSGWAPAPSQTVFVEGGRYEIPAAWRTGPMAVIAIAGIYNFEDGSFEAKQMGFHRGLVADLGGVYENRDIVLTVPLTKRLTVQFPDAPYSDITTNNYMFAILNLGGEGVHPVPGWDKQGTNSETQYTLENFAEAPGDLFTFYANFYSNTSSGRPEAFVLQDGEGPMGPAMSLGPIVGFPELVSPLPNGAMNERTIRIKTPDGPAPSFYWFTLNSFDGTSWDAFMEGNRTKLILPRFPEYLTKEYAPPNLPPGAMFGSVRTVLVPGFDYTNFSYYDLWGNTYRSWNDQDFRFVNAGN